MAGWERVWTDEQRDAVATAYEDRGIRPYKRVAELAAAGELEYEGERLAAFPMPAATIRGEVQRLRRLRAGMIGSELATLPAADAIEALRRRLLNAADGMLKLEERKPAKRRDAEVMRQIARCVREAAAIPERREPRTVAPGQRDPATGEQDGDTTGGIAGKILRAHKSGSRPAREHHEQTHTLTEKGTGSGEATRTSPVQTGAERDGSRGGGASEAETVAA